MILINRPSLVQRQCGAKNKTPFGGIVFRTINDRGTTIARQNCAILRNTGLFAKLI